MDKMEKNQIRFRADKILKKYIITVKWRSILDTKIKFLSKRTEKRKIILLNSDNKFIDLNYKGIKGNRQYVTEKNNAWVLAFVRWCDEEFIPIGDGKYSDNCDTCKTRLVFNKLLDKHFWQCKTMLDGKWIKIPYLCEATMPDEPTERRDEIRKWASKGIHPKVITYIINFMKNQGLCKKGITIGRVYHLIQDMREEKYAKLCPTKTKLDVLEKRKIIQD